MRTMQIVNIRPDGWVFAESWREATEALHFGFAELGIDIPISDNYFIPDATPIVFGAHHLSESGAGKLPADAILYNFEQLKEGYPWFKPHYLELLRRFRIWDFSTRNIEYLHRSSTSPDARHVPVGYVPQLSRIEPVAQDIDVLFFGRMTDRRKRVLEGLADLGLNVRFLVGVFGQERDRWIARSKVVLNIHASAGGLFEHLRVLYLLANKKAVVTEPGVANELDPELMLGLETVPYDRLIESCTELARNPDARQTLADTGYNIITSPSRRMSRILGGLAEFQNCSAGGTNKA
ncbi:MAG: hypothetical protein IH605_19695 [Burkholderiales bacterium]|nr:hypothetical protein [Burkholderiales bacterium]